MIFGFIKFASHNSRVSATFVNRLNLRERSAHRRQDKHEGLALGDEVDCLCSDLTVAEVPRFARVRIVDREVKLPARS